MVEESLELDGDSSLGDWQLCIEYNGGTLRLDIVLKVGRGV